MAISKTSNTDAKLVALTVKLGTYYKFYWYGILHFQKLNIKATIGKIESWKLSGGRSLNRRSYEKSRSRALS